MSLEKSPYNIIMSLRALLGFAPIQYGSYSTAPVEYHQCSYSTAPVEYMELLISDLRSTMSTELAVESSVPCLGMWMSWMSCNF